MLIGKPFTMKSFHKKKINEASETLMIYVIVNIRAVLMQQNELPLMSIVKRV